MQLTPMHTVVHIHCIGVGHIYRGHGRLSLQHAGNDVKSYNRCVGQVNCQFQLKCNTIKHWTMIVAIPCTTTVHLPKTVIKCLCDSDPDTYMCVTVTSVALYSSL